MACSKVKRAATHEENRAKVCAPCGRKILDKDKRKLNHVQINIIKDHIDSDFNIENPIFLVGICQGCRTLFFKFSKDPTKISLLPKMKNFKEMVLPRPTRQIEEPNCSCYICLTGSNTTRMPVYQKKTYDGNIEKGHGLFGYDENKLHNVKDLDKY